MTDRFCDQQYRAIFGNSIAVKMGGLRPET